MDSEALWTILQNKVSEGCTSSILYKSRYPDFWASYSTQFFNRGTVSGTQTGNFNIDIYLIQIQEKLTKIPPVSDVIPPPSGWIQHSVPHGNLL